MGFLDRFRSKSPANEIVTGRPADASPVIAPPGAQPRFAVLDVETTGLSPETSRIVEIAVVLTDIRGQVLDEWTTRVNPDGPVGATHIHGITAADVAHAPRFREIAPLLIQRLSGAAFVAHNASFDLAFISNELYWAGWALPPVPTFCTLDASRTYLPNLDRRRLVDCCWAAGIPLLGAHSALGDARATAGLLAAYLNPKRPPAPLAADLELAERALAVRWPTSAGALPDTARPRPRDIPERARIAMATPAPQPLVELVDRFSLGDALDEGAPEGSVTYLEALAAALEDGVITPKEAADLDSVTTAMQMSPDDVAAANRAFVLALAYQALDDGKVTRAERAELIHVAQLLSVEEEVVPALLERAEKARELRLSEGLKALPDGWVLGEPLRVGDKVVFTGCETEGRDELEARSTALGVRVLGGVSAKVAMLVSDGTMDGTKAAKAREVGTRIVHPRDYRRLLEYLQPAVARPARLQPTLATASGPEAAPVWPAPTATAPTTEAPAGLTPSEVRQWGRENGWSVGVRGRLNHELLAAFLAAQANAAPAG